MAEKTKLQCDNCFGNLTHTTGEYWECVNCGIKYHIPIKPPPDYVTYSCTYVAIPDWSKKK